jgi:hypothetical protein
MKKYLTGAILFVVCVVILSGCVGQATYRVVPPGNITIETLMQNWQDYDVYYAGLGPDHPSAVMFHPKNDDRVVTFDRWSKVDSRKLLGDIIDSIQRQVGLTPYYPRLFEIRGPDGHLYAFMFTAWTTVSTRLIDDRTMFVFDIPLPPYLAVNGGNSAVGTKAP